MAAFVILWASVEMLASSALQDYSPYQVVWTRYGVHLVFMMLVWRGPRHVTLWRTGRPVFQLARALLMLAMPVSWVMARDRGVQNAELGVRLNASFSRSHSPQPCFTAASMPMRGTVPSTCRR